MWNSINFTIFIFFSALNKKLKNRSEIKQFPNDKR